MEKINIFWHRRDLRYQDNVGLYHALNGDVPVLPVFIFDKNILDDLEDKRDARVEFIHSCLREIDQIYRNNNSGLLVFHTTPEEAFQELLLKYDIQGVYTNRDYEPYAKERDKAVEKLLSERGVGFYTYKDQVIFEEGEICNGSGEPYKVYTAYKRAWMSRMEDDHLHRYHSGKKLHSLWQGEVPDLPSLASIGFEKSDVEVPKPRIQEDILREYAQKRDFPAEEGTTRIGLHLRFGTVSVREAVKRGAEYSEVWLSELIWREFFMMILAHYPEVVDKSFKSRYDRIEWLNNEEHFKRWCEGTTGYPIVDAGIRELNRTGFMHNRVRMITASFLTKHLLIDWRWGERYFAQKLLDYELSSNNGNWQWAAGTGTDAQPYFRVFNPYSQQEKYDKDLVYIKKWVPEYGTEEYPEPIVEHKPARERALSTYKKAVS